jgi:hypothetical protein
VISISILMVVVVAAVAVAVLRRGSGIDVLAGGASPALRSHAAKGRPAPSALERLLGEWRDAGLLEAEQVPPIVQYEDAKHGPTSRVPIAAEAVGYVGAALVIGAVASLVGNNLEDLAVGARVAVLAVPALLAAAAGWFAGREHDPAFERLGSVLWALSVGLLAATMAEVFVDVLHDGDAPRHGGVLFVAGIALVWAAAAYAMRHLPLQHAVAFGAALATTLGVLDAARSGRDAGWSSLWWGLAVWLFGAAWFGAGLWRLMIPPVVAQILGAATLLVGAQIIRGDETVIALWLGLASAGAILAIGVARSDALVLMIGAVGLFQWSPQIATYYLEPAIGTEVTLMIVGLLLLGVAGVFTKLFRRVRSEALAEPHD